LKIREGFIMKKFKRMALVLSVIVVIVLTSSFGNLYAAGANVEKVYTTVADFNEGTINNLINEEPGQLRIDETTTPFGFIWVAVSSKGTVVKINTDTGEILGEYYTSPAGQPKNPSRTTVDKNGSVWVSNRDGNSVTRICLPESGLWIDKNGNGVCDTSTGLNDIKLWTNAGGVDTDGGVDTAEDECIINYVKVSSSGTRHVSVDANNDVWVSGTGHRIFNLIDGVTGIIKRTEGSVGYGGYGGLIDKNGVIWSSNSLLRWDTSKPLSGPNGVNWTGYNHDSYGLGIDSNGYVWNTSLNGNVIRKFAPDGTLVGQYQHGAYYSQGCVAAPNGDVWVAHSLYDSSVGHIKNDGTFVGNITVGSGPTGVAVDSRGKIWVTNMYSQTVMRIDPAAGPIGADGVTPIGAIDYTSVDLGGNLYNYSDMTGSTLIGAPNFGNWTTIFDGGEENIEWGDINWDSIVPEGSSISVTVESSNDNITYSPKETVTNGSDMSVPDGKYLKITVNMNRSENGESPVLEELSVKSANNPPDVSEAKPSKAYLWPPNNKFVDINILDVTDPDDDIVTIKITSITSDEPTASKNDKNKAPDAYGVGTDTASLRAERIGGSNGRVYEITFEASDDKGAISTGSVKVEVPHDMSYPYENAVDDGQIYDATTINY